MGLFNFGRAIVRGVAKAIKQNQQSGGSVSISRFTPEVFNQTCVVRETNTISKSLWLNFTVRGYYFNNIAADLRRQASQHFLRRNASKLPLFAFVGFCLSDSESERAAGKEASVASLFQYLSADLNRFWKDDRHATEFPSHFSEYDIGERLGKPSSNAAVYSAGFDGNNVALKIMFNYAVPSNSTAISQAFEREYRILPCAEISPPNCNSGRHDVFLQHDKANEDMVLAEHPNIIKLCRMFIDNTPLLHDALETYPMAVPKRYHRDGNGRNKTMCLVMPKYTSSLRDYLHDNKDILSNEQRLSIFCQLLEGVAHLERNSISHRDLKSDNILVDYHDDGYLRAVITDFGCCLAEENMLLPYNTVHTDRGGNFALLAPEIANAIPREGFYLDYSKSDAWTCGSIAYEIFNQDNPFYSHLCNVDYEEDVLEEIPVYSGCQFIDKVVRALLQKDPETRLSACEASTMIMLKLNAPPEWLLFPNMVTEMEIEKWLLVLSISTRRICQLYDDTRFLPPEIMLNLVFLSRTTPLEILNALLLVSKLQNS